MTFGGFILEIGATIQLSSAGTLDLGVTTTCGVIYVLLGAFSLCYICLLLTMRHSLRYANHT